MHISGKRIERLSVFLIILALISSQLSGVELAFSYDQYLLELAAEGEQVSLFIVVRELSYFFLGALLIFQGSQRRVNLVLYATIIAFLSILIIRSILINEAIVLIVYGLRIVVLLAMGFSVLTIFSNIDRIERVLMNYIFVLIALWLSSSLWQLINYQSLFGETIFGPRVSGTYLNPIIFSMVLGSSSLFLLYAKSFSGKGLILLLLFWLTLLTGGRAGILVSFISLLSHWIGRRSNYNYLLIIILPLLFFAASFSEISGRSGTESFFKDGRLSKWESLLLDFMGGEPVNFILGKSLGVGTNASRISDSSSHIVADSAFVSGLLSFGVIYVLLYIGLIVFTLYRYGSNGVPIFITLLIYSFAQNLPELHPTFLLVMAAYGILEKRKRHLVLAPRELRRFHGSRTEYQSLGIE